MNVILRSSPELEAGKFSANLQNAGACSMPVPLREHVSIGYGECRGGFSHYRWLGQHRL